ncbi:MAG: dTDP-4-dehydrorhamnose reductase [Desulfuromonadales bacterium]|nr:dTDP-4-dehydrorhamnose reductase [Desulfuromonadales bacterium]
MTAKRLALIGANGMLARKVRALAPGDYVVSNYDLPGFDLTDRAQVLAEMTRLQPDVIVNCAAFTNVDGCESQEELATRVNGVGPGYLAEAAQAVGAILVHISTDYVFSGDKGSPYTESNSTGPLSAYGRSKLAGEAAIVASGLSRYFILRTSWLYGPGGKNFVETMLRLAAERDELRVVADQIGSPTYTGDLAAAIFNLLKIVTRDDEAVTRDGLRVTGSEAEPPVTDFASPVTDFASTVTDLFGLYHFSNLGECSWHGFAETIVELAKSSGEALKANRVVPIRTDEYPLPAPRPAYSVFSKEKYLSATGATLPHWRESLALYLRERNG